MQTACFEANNISDQFDTLLDNAEIAAEFYKALSLSAGGDQSASESLSEYGIKGHSYDAGDISTGFDPENSNYVIYDDEAISIVKKLYGEKRPALAKNPDLSERSIEIIEGNRTGERLSAVNLARTRRAEPRPNRNMQQLRGIFPSRDQETFFETLKKALWEPDRKQLKKWLLKIRILLVDRYAYLAKISEEELEGSPRPSIQSGRRPLQRLGNVDGRQQGRESHSGWKADSFECCRDKNYQRRHTEKKLAPNVRASKGRLRTVE